MPESWISRHGTTLIAFGAALVLGIVALVLFRPGWHTARPPVPVGKPSNPGWKIRYDATIALARRGSAHTSIDLLEEMLDEGTQEANFRVKQADGREVVDEQGVDNMLVATLDAVQEYQAKHKEPEMATELRTVYASPRLTIMIPFVHPPPDWKEQLKPAIEKLTDNRNAAVREKAKDLLEKLS